VQLPIPGEELEIKGHPACLVRPERAAGPTPTPWVWYAPLRPDTPGDEMRWAFEQIVARGCAIACIDVGESHGSPMGVAVFTALYRGLVDQRGLSLRPALLGRSRGGLMLLNWAADNADSVACFAGIYPVCNLASYPGLVTASASYGITAAMLSAQLEKHNPIDRLASLAKADVPVFLLHGDSDQIVPHDKNSALLKDRYESLGGQATLEIIAGGGHDCQPHWFTNQNMIDFLTRRATL